MKHLFTLCTAVLSIFMLSGCDNSPMPPPEPPLPPEPTIELTNPFSIILSGMDSPESVVAEVECNGDYIYYVGVVPKASLTELDVKSDAAVLALIQGLTPEVNLRQVDNNYTYSGAATIMLSDHWELSPMVEYTIFAVSFNEEDMMLTNLYRTSFMVEEPVEPVDFTVDFDLGVPTHTKIPFSTIPSDNSTVYIINIVHKIVIDSRPAEDLMKALIDELAGSGNLEGSLVKGPLNNVEYTNLEPETEYALVAFAFDGEKAISELSYAIVKTADTPPEPALPDNIVGAISASVTSDVTHLYITTDRAGYSGNFYVGHGRQSDLDMISESAGGKNLAEAAAQWFYDLEVSEHSTDLSIVDNRYVFDHDLTDYKLQDWYTSPGGKNNFAVVFALSSSGEIDWTIDPTILFEKTKDAVDATEDFTVAIEVGKLESGETVITYTPSHKETLYYGAVFEAVVIENFVDQALFSAVTVLETYVNTLKAGDMSVVYDNLPQKAIYTALAFGVTHKKYIPVGTIVRKDFYIGSSQMIYGELSEELAVVKARAEVESIATPSRFVYRDLRL